MRNGNRGARMGPSIVFALPLALVSMLALAGSNSTTLSNGASLAVSVTDPVTSTEFEVPPGQPNIDVAVHGTASVGVGNADNTFVYIMDTSGSTTLGGGTGCSPILNCEKQFFVGLNNAVAADGSTDEVGFVTFDDFATIHDLNPGPSLFTTPSDPAVNAAINGAVAGNLTNCPDALVKATALINTASNSHKAVVFASDGVCNVGASGSVAAAAAALGATGAVVNAIAVGTNSSCTTNGGAGRLDEIPQNGGTCVHVQDPGNLPDLIQNLTGSKLNSLEISVDGGAPQAITNTSLPLPQNGAISVNYTTSADDLGPGDHTFCVTAHGSDVLGDNEAVTQCETIHLLQLSAAPAEASNELGSDNTHTVTATIAGPASHIAARHVTFAVTGTNAGATGVCIPASCDTDATGKVSFTYSVPVAPSSLGTDTITVTTEIAGHDTSVSVIKHWVDTTPPVVACPEGPNPGGHVPKAHNEDGFFRLTATDAVDPNPKIYVVDLGTGTVFGPFASGTTVKYTQAPGATPSISPGSGDVDWKIKSKGDMGVYAVDGSGNQSATVSCLVPPPPK